MHLAEVFLGQKFYRRKKKNNYVGWIYAHLAMCARHMPESHLQLIITQVRAEQVIITIICTKGVIPA